jgi:hypothetical protein
MSERFRLAGMRIAVSAGSAAEASSVVSFLRGEAATVVAGNELRACFSDSTPRSSTVLDGWVSLLRASAVTLHEPSPSDDTSDTDETFAYIASANSMLRDAASVVLVVPVRSTEVQRTTGIMSPEAIADGLTRQLARRLVERRIRVNGLLLPVEAESSRVIPKAPSDWARLQLGAGTLTYLLSNESRWITGQVIPIAGARY